MVELVREETRRYNHVSGLTAGEFMGGGKDKSLTGKIWLGIFKGCEGRQMGLTHIIEKGT